MFLLLSLCMEVSFIIPTLNEEKLIEQCLRSIKGQKTKLKYEIIVSDGNSKDNTRKIAKKYAKVVICKQKGIPHARNYGASFAKGKLFVFIDADVILPSDYIEKIWKRFEEKKRTYCFISKNILHREIFVYYIY